MCHVVECETLDNIEPRIAEEPSENGPCGEEFRPNPHGLQ